MKKIGFITTPLISGHSIRGVGFYTKNLLGPLKNQAANEDLEIVEVSDLEKTDTSKLDLVHYPFFDPLRLTLPIFKETKTVVTIHDVIPLEYPKAYPPGIQGFLNLQLQKMSLTNVDLVVTDSMASVKSIHTLLAVPHQKIRLVYLAADSIYRPIKNKSNLTKIKSKYNLPGRFVLYVGDINYNKNIPSLVQASKLAKLPLVIVGKQANEINPGNLSHPELAHLKDVDLSKTMRLGFIPDSDLAAIYNLATVYCQPSYSEGFGIPVLEALACGTPVVCSNVGSLVEIAGNKAFYFDPRDVQAMAKAISRPQTRIYSPIESKFSWDKAAYETLLVYKELV